ncbi:MAG: mechanosensitive ion channel [Deltaproteobacteria bacterium]|nr:mechanosensitive ion channel [Deltaproteobacteria bacterium]
MIVQRLTFILDVLIGVVVLAAFLTAWQVYDTPAEAISGLLSLGVTVGSQRLTLGLVVAAIGVVGISYLASSMLQSLLLSEDGLIGPEVETGVRVAVARLVHYVLASVGFVVALAVLGVDLTKMTLLASALGIGIGFGLQTVVSNFVCGLTLLFERPLRVGDTIEFGGRRAKISKIGLRSTTVRRSDQADIIVPNTELITHRVINWTLTDRYARITIPVRAVYGSDIPLVMQTLKECALAHPGVMKNPEPRILFRNFAGSALDFELHAWIVEVDNRLQIESDLHQEIARRFRQASIETPS